MKIIKKTSPQEKVTYGFRVSDVEHKELKRIKKELGWDLQAMFLGHAKEIINKAKVKFKT